MDTFTRKISGPPGPCSTQFQVLVTDDEPMLRSVIGEFLETLDFCGFYEAGDGTEALEHLRAHPVDCILSDMRMPRMNLSELIRILNAEFPDVAVIATSGYSDLDNACGILEQGAHDFLAKPLDLDALELALEWICARARILAFTGDLFAHEIENSRSVWMDRFNAVARALAYEAGAFADRMHHARRVAALAEIVVVEPEAARRELMLAALLHEIGASSQSLRIASAERALRDNELRLVRIQARMSARLLKRCLPDRPTAAIVERHLEWGEENAAEEPQWGETRRLACMLGGLNTVDGLLSERPDREGHSLGRAHEILKEYYSKTQLGVLKQTLSKWEAIGELYAKVNA